MKNKPHRPASASAPERAESKFRLLHENISDAFVSVSMSGRILEHNAAYRAMLGYSDEELRQLTYRDLTPAKWHAFEAGIVRQVRERGASDLYEKEYRRKDGTVFPVELRTLLRRDAAGRAAGMWAIIRDITARKSAEAAHREGESRLRKILEHAPMSMAVVGMDGTIEYINRKAVETFGYAAEDIPTMDRWWAQAYPDPACRRASMERWMGYVGAAIAQGREIQRDDYRITCKDGTVKTVSVFGVPVADKVFVMFDDITLRALKEELLRQSHAELERRVRERTAELAERNRALHAEIVERRQVEAHLVQANLKLERTSKHLHKLGAKLAQVEERERKRMAHILHDQLQQLLVGASFSLSALEKGLRDAEQIGNVRSVRMAVDQALGESKSLVLELSPPILREGGLEAAMKWLRRRMQEMHALTVHVDVDERAERVGEDLRVAVFRAVRELLLNVVKHAAVSVATVRISVRPKGRIRVVVADKGRGHLPAPPDHEKDLELGFGLSAVRERFESLGGSVTVESAPGAGCRVTLLAPLAASPASGPAPSREGAAAPAAGGGGGARRPARKAAGRRTRPPATRGPQVGAGNRPS